MSKTHLYSPYFTTGERRKLKSVTEEHVTSEINLLRGLLARTLASESQSLPLTLDSRIALLGSLSHATFEIGGLVRLEGKYHSRLGELTATIFEALASMDHSKL